MSWDEWEEILLGNCTEEKNIKPFMPQKHYALFAAGLELVVLPKQPEPRKQQ